MQYAVLFISLMFLLRPEHIESNEKCFRVKRMFLEVGALNKLPLSFIDACIKKK